MALSNDQVRQLMDAFVQSPQFLALPEGRARTDAFNAYFNQVTSGHAPSAFGTGGFFQAIPGQSKEETLFTRIAGGVAGGALGASALGMTGPAASTASTAAGGATARGGTAAEQAAADSAVPGLESSDLTMTNGAPPPAVPPIAGDAGTSFGGGGSAGMASQIAQIAAKLGIPLGTFLATKSSTPSTSSEVSDLLKNIPQLNDLLNIQVSAAKQSTPVRQAVQQMALNLLPRSARSAYPGVPDIRSL
jgi:hypothetical protein